MCKERRRLQEIELPQFRFQVRRFSQATPFKSEEIEGSTCYMFEASTLSVVGDMFWSELSVNENTSLLPKPTSLSLPYLNDVGLPFYIAPGTEVGSPTASTTRISEQTVKCSLPECGETLKVNVMRQHMGAHLLHERSKFNAVMPCGFCGGESAQKSSDLSQLSGCAIWLLNGQARMYCKWTRPDTRLRAPKSVLVPRPALIAQCSAHFVQKSRG